MLTESPPEHLNPKLPHRSVWLVAAAIAFCLLGDQALYSVLPIHFQNLGLMPFQVGILLSANRWIRLFTNQLAEKLTRVIDPLVLMPLALVLGAILTLFYGSVTHFYLLLGARLLWGFSWSCQRQIGIMTSIGTAAEQHTASTIGFFNGIVRLGSMGGLFAGALLYDIVGFSQAFFILAAASVVSIPLGFFSQKLRPSIEPLVTDKNQKYPGGKSVYLFFAGFVVGCVGPGLISSTLGFVLKTQVGDSLTILSVVVGIATINGILLAFPSVINILGAPLLGAFLDWFGHDRGVLLLFGVATIALVGAAVLSHAAWLILLILIFFVCQAGIPIMLSVRTGRDGPKTYAVFASFADLGSAVGPIIGWTIFEFVALPNITFIIGAVLYAIATLFSLREFRLLRQRY